MSRRFTNLAPPSPFHKFGDQKANINGMSQYLKYMLAIQEDIYDGIYEQLLIEPYVQDSNNYIGIIELVYLQGPKAHA